MRSKKIITGLDDTQRQRPDLALWLQCSIMALVASGRPARRAARQARRCAPWMSRKSPTPRSLQRRNRRCGRITRTNAPRAVLRPVQSSTGSSEPTTTAVVFSDAGETQFPHRGKLRMTHPARIGDSVNRLTEGTSYEDESASDDRSEFG